MVTIGVSAFGLLVSLLYLIGNAAGSPGLRRRLEGVLDVCLSAILCICFLALGAWLLLGARATGCLAPNKLVPVNATNTTEPIKLTPTNATNATDATLTPKRVFVESIGSVNPGNDISCGQLTWDNKPATFCKICGGRGKVEAACNNNTACVAYDFEEQGEFRGCGYLKSGVSPLSPRDGLSSYVIEALSDKAVQNTAADTYIEVTGAAIPGHDLPCGQKQPGGGSSQQCKVCGGRAAVQEACDALPTCRAYDMLDAGPDKGCGFLKKNPGPTEFTPGHDSYIESSFQGRRRRLLAAPRETAEAVTALAKGSLMPSIRTMCIVFDISFALAFVLGALFAGTAVVGGYAMRHGQGLLPLNVVREDEWKAAIDSIAPSAAAAAWPPPSPPPPASPIPNVLAPGGAYVQQQPPPAAAAAALPPPATPPLPAPAGGGAGAPAAAGPQGWTELPNGAGVVFNSPPPLGPYQPQQQQPRQAPQGLYDALFPEDEPGGPRPPRVPIPATKAGPR